METKHVKHFVKCDYCGIEFEYYEKHYYMCKDCKNNKQWIRRPNVLGDEK